MKICGIDPGTSDIAPGGLCFLTKTTVAIVPMPTKRLDRPTVGKKYYKITDIPALAQCMRDELPDLVVIEAQSSRPGENRSSGGRSLIHYGTILGVVGTLGIAYETVYPVVWKRAMGLFGKTKDDSRELAGKLIPHGARFWPRHKDHGLAEAALLAYWRMHNA